jgi:hypothetical protein
MLAIKPIIYFLNFLYVFKKHPKVKIKAQLESAFEKQFYFLKAFADWLRRYEQFTQEKLRNGHVNMLCRLFKFAI